MALIYLKSRREPIEISNDKARKIKMDWTSKPSPSDMVDLGWMQFTFGQLKTIELTKERKTGDEDWYRPLTKEEIANNATVMARVRANLEAKGVIVRKSWGSQKQNN